MKYLFPLLALFSVAFADDNIEYRFDKRRLPDFTLSPAPVELSDNQAIAGFLQFGGLTFRANGTYGICFNEIHLCKVSVEFLSQKLGFQFNSGRTHRWVSQGAIGAMYRLPLCISWVNSIDVGFNYSNALSRTMQIKIVPDHEVFSKRRLAGSDAFGLSLISNFQPWESGIITGKLFYDYVRYRRHYERKVTTSGVGLGISWDQNVFNWFSFHLGADVRDPFIFYHASLRSPLFYFSPRSSFSLFAEKIQGRHKSPSSSRIGIELEFAFGKARTCSGDVIELSPYPPSCAAKYVATPAVYMPEVLVIKDECHKVLWVAPIALASEDEFNAPLGPFVLDVSPFFEGTSPLIFGANNLPNGFQINPLTGVISGVVDGSLSGSYSFEVFATNYSGRAFKTITLNFSL